MWPFLAFTFAHLDPIETGGIILGGVIALLGALKCSSIMRRPATSTPCVLSLGIVMIAWFLLQVSVLATKIFQLPQSLNPLFALLGFMLILAALVLAIVGLSTYDRERFVQGKAQAIWGLVISSGLVVLLLVSIVIGFRQANSGRMASSPGASFETPGLYKNTDFNFSIQAPPDWFPVNATALTPLATCAHRRRGYDAYSIVIAENLGGNVPVDTIVELTKNGLTASGHVMNQTLATVPLGKNTFSKLSSVVKVDRLKATLYYEHWLLTSGDFSWQIITWGALQARPMIEREAREFASGFRILDNTNATGQGDFQDQLHLADGYTTRLSGQGWNQSRIQNIPLASTIVERRNEGLLVIPLHFETESDLPVPPIEALGRAALNMLGIPQEDIANHPTSEWNPSSGTGLEVQAEHQIDNEDFNYILRIARGDEMAHLLVGWYSRKLGDEKLVRRGLESIALEPPIGKPAELSDQAKLNWALVLNNIGLHHYARNEQSEATLWFRHAFKNHPKDPAVLHNLMGGLIESEQLQEARKLVDTHRGSFPKETFFLVQEAKLQAAEQDLDSANQTFLRAIEQGHTDENDWISWLVQLSSAERYDLALLTADAYTAKRPTLTARRWQAQSAKNAGEHDRAVALLEKLAKEYPSNQEIAYELAETYNASGDYNQASELAETLIKKKQNDLRARHILGWSQVGKKWYREAKDTFEAIAGDKPDYPEIQDSLKFVSAMLGQGDNSTIKSPITSVPVPEELQKIITDFTYPDTTQDEGRSVQRLLRIKSFHFEKDKPLRTTITQRIKVLNAEGANELSSFQFSFDPLFERIHLNSLEVFDASGKHLAHGSAEDAYVLDASQDTHDQDKVLHLPVPSVSPGCIVAVTITTESLSPVKHFPYTPIYFAETDLNAVTLSGDISSIKTELALGDTLTAIKSPQTLVWYGKGLPAFHAEPFSVPISEQLPSLVMVGDEGSWGELTKDYLSDIKDLLVGDETVQKLASEITQGAKTDLERIDVLTRYVQKQIAYRAIEFGIRARRPNSAAATLKNCYGDCKDQSLLLYQLLRAQNIECHLALVHNYFPTKPDLPSLDQFNHMVLHVPALGKDRLVDPTDKYLDLNRWQADNLWHSQALILDAEEPRLLPSSTPALDSSRMQSQRTVTPDGNHWKVQETFTAHGYAASWLRSLFAGLDVKDHTRQAQNLLAQNGEAQLHEFRFEHFDDIGEPAVLHLAYTARNTLHREDTKITGALPAFFERHYIDLPFVADRKTAFILRYQSQFRSQVTLHLPATLEPSVLSGLTQQSSNSYCTWQAQSKAKDGIATSYDIQFSFDSTAGHHPAEVYSSCREAWDQPRLWWGRPLSWSDSTPIPTTAP